MSLPPALSIALAASGAVAFASILLFYAAYFRNTTLGLRKARLFLKYGRFEKNFVVVAVLAVAATVLLLATLAVAPELIDDVPDVPFLVAIILPLCMGYIYAYFVGRGKEPPVDRFLRMLRERRP